MSSVLYFAYGSNLLSARLRERTPSARALGVGVLPGHALRWHKVAADGSGKCDVVAVEDPKSQVHGVLYELDAHEKPLLDAAETLGVGYGERLFEIAHGNSTRLAWVYYALLTDPAVRPFDWYKALVVAGAREHALEPGYIRALESVIAMPDSDPARAQRHFRLVNAGPGVSTLPGLAEARRA